MPLRFFTVPTFEQISGQQQPAVVVDVGLLLKTILLDLCQNHLDILHYMSVPSHLQNKRFVLKFKFRRNASKFPIFIYIGAKLGGAAGARAPPLLHNPRNFIV